LTDREHEIVQAIFDDRAEASIARELGISAHTVHSHVERIYQKCRVNSRVSLVLRIVNEHIRACAPAKVKGVGPPI
jgi:DNA-binding NarL/FixJ family response regulator